MPITHSNTLLYCVGDAYIPKHIPFNLCVLGINRKAIFNASVEQVVFNSNFLTGVLCTNGGRSSLTEPTNG